MSQSGGKEAKANILEALAGSVLSAVTSSNLPLWLRTSWLKSFNIMLVRAPTASCALVADDSAAPVYAMFDVDAASNTCGVADPFEVAFACFQCCYGSWNFVACSYVVACAFDAHDCLILCC